MANRRFNFWSFMVCFLIGTSQGLPQGALNNESILKLLGAQMGDGVIVRLISAEKGSYDTSPEALIALKQGGASISVITAIVNHATEPDRQPSQTDSKQAAKTDPVARFLANEGSDRDTSRSQHPETVRSGRQSRDRGGRILTEESSFRNKALVLEDGTPIRLRFARALTSAQAKVGDTARFEVLDDVSIARVLVIPSGSKATGTVVDSQHKRILGIGGKLGLALDWVQLEDGNRIAIRAEQQLTDTRRLAQSDRMLVNMPIEWPVTPLIVLKGKDAVIARGTEITAYCDGDANFYSKDY